MNKYVALGVRQLFGGARRGQPYMAGLGAAIALVSWLRNRAGPDSKPIYRRTLRDGESVTIRLVRGATTIDDVTVAGG